MTQMKTDSDLKREETIRDFQAEKLLLTSQMARDKAHMKKEFQEKEAQMMVEKERLQKDINAYTTKLMRQDNFKAAPDIESSPNSRHLRRILRHLLRWNGDLIRQNGLFRGSNNFQQTKDCSRCRSCKTCCGAY